MIRVNTTFTVLDPTKRKTVYDWSRTVKNVLTPADTTSFLSHNTPKLISPTVVDAQACERSFVVLRERKENMSAATATTKESVAAYGGGLDLKFMSAHAMANDRKCGGKLLHGSAAKQDAGNYTAIANATGHCRAKCSSNKDLASLWKCTCPCTQAAFQALNLTFAAKMVCK